MTALRSFVVCCENRDKTAPYLEALATHGVGRDQVRIVTPGDRPESPTTLAETAAGLLLCGGPDVHPGRYGEEPLADAGLEVVPELDQLEWELLTGARQAATPVFGICRGMQVINVFLGGDLYQDVQLQVRGVTQHYIRYAPDHPTHTVHVIRQDLPLGRILARDTLVANSRHHQAVRRLGSNLVPVAYSPDGLLEVMQLPPGGWWVWSVQWHPENLIENPLQREIWREFVQAGRAHVGEPAPQPAGSKS